MAPGTKGVTMTRRTTLALLSALTACLGLVLAGLVAAPAQAAKTSVNGTNAYKKLVLDNQQKRVVLKMTAPGGPCSIKYLKATFRDKDGTTYSVDGGCYPGAVWAASLTRGNKLVDCGGLSLGYNADKGVWTAKVPRGCLKKLADRIKVTESYVDDYSPNPGYAGPTKYVARG
jgi:hypothetical protein